MRGLIQWAVSGAALILIVLAVRYLFRNKLSARLRYALWGVVLLRLLVPFQVELPADAPVPVLASNAVPELGQWEERSIPVFPEGSEPVAEFDSMIENVLEPGEIRPYQNGAGGQQRSIDGETIIWYRYILSPEQILLALWLAGAGLTGAVILLSDLRFGLGLRKRRVMLGRPHPSSPAAIPPSPKGEGLALRETGVPVYMAEGLASPCLFGIFPPAVYLSPETAEDETALRHVLAHELTHYAHKDHLWSLLRCLALALHWYDPLVWLAAALSKQDGELACDEGAVARLGEEERIPYGRTLVDMVAKRSLRPADLLSMSTAMTGGGKSVKQRVAQIVKKSETVKTALFAAIALVALAVVFVFTGREEQRPDLYGPYRYQVGRTQAVRYSPSPFSSQSYPDAITDPDLLEKALDILDHAADLLNTPEELDLDLSDAPFLSPRVTLLEGPDGSGHTYLLYTAHAVNGDRCYLVTPAEIGAESYAVAAVLDTSAPGALELLARQQRLRTQGDDRILEAYRETVTRANSVAFVPSLLPGTAYPTIIDDDSVSQAKEILLDISPLRSGERPDLTGLASAPSVTLLGAYDTNDLMQVEYRLPSQDGRTYVLAWSSQPDGSTGYEVVGSFPDTVCSRLDELARTNGAPQAEGPDRIHPVTDS